jgi:uncharacterized protein (DUF1697 family)
MKELAALFASVGAEDVSTHIQSGNVLFRATPVEAAKLCTSIPQEIAKAHGLRVPVQVRSLDQLARIVAENPFLKEQADSTLLNVVFLSSTPSSAQIASLDPMRSPPDRFVVRGDTIYLFTPNGMGKTKITNVWLDAKLGAVSTVRNWAVTQKLLELLQTMQRST